MVYQNRFDLNHRSGKNIQKVRKFSNISALNARSFMSFDDLFLRLTVDLYNNQKLFHSWNMVFVYVRIYKTDLESIHQTFSRGFEG